MKQKFLAIIVLSVSFFMSEGMSYAQSNQEIQTPEEIAALETEKLGELLKLEDWQMFYVDSTLQTNYTNLQAELKKLQQARVENTSIYRDVRDKWMDKTDASFKKYFTEEQWNKYLRSGVGGSRKEKEKRAQKNQRK